MAELLGVSVPWFDAHYRPRLGADDVRRQGREIAIRGRACVELYLADQLGRGGGDVDPALVGPESPMLERLREETWRLRKLDRLEREQKLVDRDALGQQLGRIAAALRNCGEQMERRWPEAAALLGRTLDDLEGWLIRQGGNDAGEHDGAQRTSGDGNGSAGASRSARARAARATAGTAGGQPEKRANGNAARRTGAKARRGKRA